MSDMDTIPLVVGVFGGLIAGGIAAEKNRQPLAWFLFGALLPLIAILIISFKPALPDQRATAAVRS
ncbi:MAG TPA: hypothetical protein VGM90_02680 [Kofleriaceae bacterium]|jgi:hypothetical protein